MSWCKAVIQVSTCSAITAATHHSFWHLYKRVTDEMFIEAAHALADQVTLGELEQGLLFPPQSNILETEIKIAARVAKVVFDNNLARIAPPADCEALIRRHVYKPEYRNLV